jgi:hypothetical protein
MKKKDGWTLRVAAVQMEIYSLHPLQARDVMAFSGLPTSASVSRSPGAHTQNQSNDEP